MTKPREEDRSVRERDVKILIGAVTLVVSSIVFMFTTFATVDYVDDKQTQTQRAFEEQNQRLTRIEAAMEKNRDMIIRAIESGRRR